MPAAAVLSVRQRSEWVERAFDQELFHSLTRKHESAMARAEGVACGEEEEGVGWIIKPRSPLSQPELQLVASAFEEEKSEPEGRE
jgi:hypothetical protein